MGIFYSVVFKKINKQLLAYFFSLVYSDYLSFQEAAEQFQPFIKFFATFEKSVSIFLL